MKRAEIDRKFDEIVAFAEIERFLDTPVKHYSTGMYLRLAFAVAAHLEPEILLVDEVLAVGDSEFQKKCLGKMGDVARAGRTVLFVSHNLAAVQQFWNKAVWLVLPTWHWPSATTPSRCAESPRRASPNAPTERAANGSGSRRSPFAMPMAGRFARRSRARMWC